VGLLPLSPDRSGARLSRQRSLSRTLLEHASLATAGPWARTGFAPSTSLCGSWPRLGQSAQPRMTDSLRYCAVRSAALLYLRVRKYSALWPLAANGSRCAAGRGARCARRPETSPWSNRDCLLTSCGSSTVGRNPRVVSRNVSVPCPMDVSSGTKTFCGYIIYAALRTAQIPESQSQRIATRG